MNTNPRPISILLIACLYLAVNVAGIVAHFHGLLAWEQGSTWAEGTEFVGLLCGVFMLLGHNWARWLAVAWILFHVILSAMHSWGETVMHGLFCVAIAWILFRPESSRYFRGARVEST
jgi:hypothetical protein